MNVVDTSRWDKLRALTEVKPVVKVPPLSEEVFLKMLTSHPKEAQILIKRDENQELYCRLLKRSAKISNNAMWNDKGRSKRSPMWKECDMPWDDGVKKSPKPRKKKPPEPKVVYDINKDPVALRVRACADQKMNKKTTMFLVGLTRTALRLITDRYDEIKFVAPHQASKFL